MNGVGSPAMEAAKKTSSSGFKKGGKIKALKTGGMVSGKAPLPRLDKRARGGRMASGGSPFSAANKQSGRDNAASSNGHESSGGKG